MRYSRKEDQRKLVNAQVSQWKPITEDLPLRRLDIIKKNQSKAIMRNTAREDRQG
jgi:hypothetical protein